MPMDCDDDDVSRHSFQLASESRSKSSSVLRPYDFLKFDFDDSLQGHLRFDSLVETEVFLGIQSQEDNRWIEEYSRGSNGMEFNSNPADSRVIPRRDNVWSEATSSESVEMLLSSVGQEEMMPSVSTIPGTNACDDHSASTRHVESCIGQDLRNSATIKPEETILNDNSTQDMCMVEKLPHAVGPSLTAENFGSSFEHLQNLTQDTVCATSGMSENAEHSHYSVPADENIKEPSKFDSSQLSMLSSTEATLQTDVNFSHKSCNEGGQERHVSILTEVKDNLNLEGKTGESSVNVSAMGDAPCLVPESGAEESINAAKTIIECPKISDCKSIICEKEDQLISRVEDEKHSFFRTSAQTDDSEAKCFAANDDMEEALDGYQGGSPIDGRRKHSVDLSCVDRHCTSPDRKGDSSTQMITGQDDGMLEDKQTSQSQRTLTETPLSVLQDNKLPSETGDLRKNTDISKSNDISSDAENNRTGKGECCGNESTFTLEELGAHISGHVAGNSRDMIVDDVAHPRAEFSETKRVVCGSRKPDGKSSVGTGSMELANVETLKTDLGTQCVGEDEMVKDNDSLPKTQNQTPGRTEADVLAPQAESNAVAAVASLSENILSESSVILSSDSSPKEVAITKSPDVHFRTEADNVSEVKDGSNYVRSPLSEVAAKSLQSVEKCNEMGSSRFPSTELTNSLHLDIPKVSSGHDNSILKGNSIDNVDGGCNHESSLVKSGGDHELTPAAEIDKASCGSSTIICSSEPSQMETDDQKEVRCSVVTDKSVEDNQFTSEDIKRKDLLGDDSSFTFKVDAMPDTTREPGKSWALFRDADICNSPAVAKESTSSVKGKTERLPSPKTPHQGTQMTDGEALQETAKGTSQRKGRGASGKGATKESAKKKSQVKGTSKEISAGTVDKGAGVSPTSNLPDVNASALSKSTSMSPTYRQAFTELQQVQLRAQIFVYGSLIQGSTPDEACMVSAFGPSGRSTWDPIWRAAIERVRTQKSRPSAAETPLHLQSGASPSDSAAKKSVHPSKLPATRVDKVSKKDTSATMASPIIPLSSPLWSISTSSRDSLPTSTLPKGPVMDFQQPFTPLHSYQTPPVRSFVDHTSWPNQTRFSAPWLASPQTATFNSSTCFQPATMTETVKLTPVNDNSLPLVPGVKQMASSSIVHTVDPSPMYRGFPSPDPKTTSPEQPSGSMKPMKRKKIPGSDPVHSTFVAEAQTPPVVIHVQSSPPVPDATLATSVADASTLCPIVPPQTCESDKVKSVPCSEETLKNIVNAKTEAENASKLAANAVTLCEEFWGKLARQKESGVTSEMENKLISVAAAISAAASVAKAAASAANVAFNAALQAKLMADEAFLSGKPGVLVPPSSTSSGDVHDARNATPAPVLKGVKSSKGTNLILVAGTPRVETITAASKQAENWDAIVKAAELAASAISQAGKIVTMGEPLPLVDIIEAGPDGYWKLPQTLTDQAGRSRDEKKEHFGTTDVKESAGVHARVPGEDSVAKGGTRKRGPGKTRQSGKLKDSMNTQISFGDGSMRSMETDGKDSRTERDAEMITGVASETDIAQRNVMPYEVKSTAESIKEGSSVEVFKCGESLKSAWYSASVLKLEDRNAYVCYSDLSSSEGSGSFCEWVCVEGEGEKAPVIRAAHTSSSFQYQGTRKRRRADLGDYAWCVGDKVDVWIDDCWWEGLVTEKNEKDETTLKVHFPAQGETSIVRAWNLRTSRSWIGGKWVECSSKKAHDSSDHSDAPKEKRQKMGSPAIATQAKDKLYNVGELPSGNRDELNFLPLSTNERTFDVGKSTKEENKGVARRPLRSGQQKEGSRLIFGIPKPTGKKQKFMEVSKQFPARKGDKSNNAPDQVKVAKHAMPQGTGSRGWKLPSRNDSKEKRTFEPKPRIPSFRKSHRTLPQRGHHESRSGLDVDSGSSHDTDPENCLGHDDNSSEKVTDPDFSVTDELAEVPLSSLISQSLSAGSKKTLLNSRSERPLSNSRFDRLNRGKLAPSGGKLTKIHEDKADSGTFVREDNEPRRSNRRFQPTHRLLEGLQSSMVIPKMPPVSHDKNLRKPRRNVLTRGK